VPKFDFLLDYLQQKSTPGGTQRNWDSYGNKISLLTDTQRMILADPQTSGGLLVCVDAAHQQDFELFAKSKGLKLISFGHLVKKADKAIIVK
ncbi:MAG: selenide, water dikinase SelD, partial [Cyclobacteriaceae bacterium]